MTIKHNIGSTQLDTFSHYFSSLKEHYVLIGGTATSLLLTDADLSISSRTTKDLDIVLC